MYTRRENTKRIKDVCKLYRSMFPGQGVVFMYSTIMKEGDYGNIMWFDPVENAFYTNMHERHFLKEYTNEELDTITGEMIKQIGEDIEKKYLSVKKVYSDFLVKFK